MVPGSALRYIIPSILIRIVFLMMIISEFKSFNTIIAIIELILNILMVIFFGKIVNVVNNYHKINKDGVSDFVDSKL